MESERYSFSPNTFRSFGKLAQIEYALAALAAESPTVGVKASNGVVFATENKHKSILYDEYNVNKVEVTESDVPTGQVSNTETSIAPTIFDPAPKKARLSGAAKKRLNWHLRQGKPYEEARALALQPVFEPNSKRLRSDGSSPLEKGKHEKKPEEALNTPPSLESLHSPTADGVNYSNAIKDVKLGVLHLNHPTKILTTRQTEEALEAILDLALTQGRITPQFTGSLPKSGYCILTCANDETAQWVKSLNGKITLSDGTPIKMVGEQDLPKRVRAIGHFKGCESYPTDKILKLIMSQNKGINTEEWKVIRRTTNGLFTTLIISMDDKSVEFFKKNGSSIHFRFDYAQIKVRGIKPSSDNPATTSQEKSGTKNLNKEASCSRPSTSSEGTTQRESSNNPLKPEDAFYSFYSSSKDTEDLQRSPFLHTLSQTRTRIAPSLRVTTSEPNRMDTNIYLATLKDRFQPRKGNPPMPFRRD